jgi:hypothetical protein
MKNQNEKKKKEKNQPRGKIPITQRRGMCDN